MVLGPRGASVTFSGDGPVVERRLGDGYDHSTCIRGFSLLSRPARLDVRLSDPGTLNTVSGSRRRLRDSHDHCWPVVQCPSKWRWQSREDNRTVQMLIRSRRLLHPCALPASGSCFRTPYISATDLFEAIGAEIFSSILIFRLPVINEFFDGSKY